jgi:carbamoyl-phosphate synthase large subunit
VLIDSYLQDAVEVDVDAIADRTGAVVVAGVMEHIEQAGIHSGDSACSLPPYSLADGIVTEIRAQTEKLARALDVVGLMNVQYAVKDGDVYVIEVNPRASRTVPFVAKATGLAVAKIGARVMAGATLAELGISEAPAIDHVAVKEAVFPFARFPGVDTLLGPEMKSTGEVMGLDADFGLAFAKSQLAAGSDLPSQGTAFISVRNRDKAAIVGLAQRLRTAGFTLIATRGTAAYLSQHGIEVTTVNKVLEGRPHVVDALLNNDVHLMFNTSEGGQSIADSFTLRRAALTANVPYYTTVAGGLAVVGAIEAIARGGLEVAPLQSYFIASF